MSLLWYAMRSKPNKEALLSTQLELHGIEAFFPVLRIKPVNPRARKFRPFFPGYLFVHVDLEKISTSTLHWMPGAENLVSFDGRPASVPDNLISAIEHQLEQINTSQQTMLLGLQPGDAVVIHDGPFAGYEAIFDGQIPGRERVRVLLTYLQKRQFPLELTGDQITPVKRP